MKFIISGKNITVTDGLRTAVEDKLGKLERYFTPDTEVVVTLSVEKERDVYKRQDSRCAFHVFKYRRIHCRNCPFRYPCY